MERRTHTDGTSNTAGRPYTERFLFASTALAGSIRSAVYLDGFGRRSRRVLEQAEGSFSGTAWFYDYQGRRVHETYPVGCADADCTNLASPVSPAITRTYDALGRLTREGTPSGHDLVAYGSLSRSQPAVGGAGSDFDAVLVKDHNGHVSRRVFDGERVVWADECDSGSSVAPSTEDPSSLVCSDYDSTFYGYDADGALTGVYDSVATSTPDYSSHARAIRYFYDTLRRVHAISDPDLVPDAQGYTVRNTFFANGTLQSATNARGWITTFGYDVLDRTIGIDRPGTEADYTFTYDPHSGGRATADATGEFSQVFEYDPWGRQSRLVQTAGGVTLVLDAEFDLLGRTTQVIYPTNAIASYEYDGARLDRVCSAPNCSGSLQWIGVEARDGIGRPTQVRNGGSTIQTLDFDPLDYRLDSRQVVSSGNSLIDLVYQYDNVGNIKSVVDTHDTPDGVDSTAVYTYDHRDRLQSSQIATGPTVHFTYDQLGNLTGRSVATAGATNQVFDPTSRPHAVRSSTFSGKSYAYDPDGNLTQRGTGYLEYDSANRLVCFGTGSACSSTFTYDGDGSRIAESTASGTKILLGGLFEWNVTPGTSVSYVHAFGKRVASVHHSKPTLRTAWVPPWMPSIDPWTVLRVLWGLLSLSLAALILVLGRRVLVRRPVYASIACTVLFAMVAQPMAATPPPGGNVSTRRLLFQDHTGSTVLVADFNGNEVKRRAFEPFGLVHAESGTGPNDPEPTAQLFTGQRYQADVGLYDFGARWYDAETGRFASIDPIIQTVQDPQTVNPYTYVRNNPVNHFDPTGLGFFSWVKRQIGKVVKYLVKAVKIIVGIALIAFAIYTYNPEAGYIGLALIASGIGYAAQGVRDLSQSGMNYVKREPAREAAGGPPGIGVLRGLLYFRHHIARGLRWVIQKLRGAGRVGARSREAVERVAKEGVEIADSQFGKKVAKHADDFGLDPSKAADREKFKSIIEGVIDNADDVVQGTFAGQKGAVDFIIRGTDVVVSNAGKFVTILKDGVLNNPSVQRAIAAAAGGGGG